MLALALSVLVLLAATACDGDSEPHDDSEMGPEPWGPSAYMDTARGLWDLALEQDKAAFWDPTTGKRSKTAGDPRTYEKACGVRFVLDDGSLPKWGAAPNGTDLDHFQKGFPDGTYYDWLRSDPQRWSAFNAWLLDPAVIASVAVGLNADTLERYPRNPTPDYLQETGTVGDDSRCKDAASKVTTSPSS